MDTCCCYFLATVDNSEDHRSANVHLKPCASIHAVGLLECMSVLSLTVSAAGVRSPQLRVPVHLRTGLWFPNHHHLLVLVPPPSCGNNCPSECEVSIHYSSRRCCGRSVARLCHSSWKVEEKDCQGLQAIPGYTELAERAWASTQRLKTLVLATKHM